MKQNCILLIIFAFSCQAENHQYNKILSCIGEELNSKEVKEVITEYKLIKKVIKGHPKYYSYETGLTLISDKEKVWRVILHIRREKTLYNHKNLPLDVDIETSPEELIKQNGKPEGDTFEAEFSERYITFVKPNYRYQFLFDNNNALLQVMVDKTLLNKK
ncbi:MAG: hypothetical protein NE330_11945 [Lentisphaeraceae bacterium]|nr:hypothetical protein [Lentisphaeraceae bacterium]